MYFGVADKTVISGSSSDDLRVHKMDRGQNQSQRHEIKNAGDDSGAVKNKRQRKHPGADDERGEERRRD